MTDLIERLRRGVAYDYDGYKGYKLMQEAADEIERLTALREEDREDMQRLSDQVDYLSDESAKLQAALTRIATMPPVSDEFGYQGYDADKMAAIARDALEGEK